MGSLSLASDLSERKQQAAEKLYNININLQEMDKQLAQMGILYAREWAFVCVVCVPVFAFCVYCTFEPLKAK